MIFQLAELALFSLRHLLWCLNYKTFVRHLLCDQDFDKAVEKSNPTKLQSAGWTYSNHKIPMTLGFSRSRQEVTFLESVWGLLTEIYLGSTLCGA